MYADKSGGSQRNDDMVDSVQPTGTQRKNNMADVVEAESVINAACGDVLQRVRYLRIDVDGMDRLAKVMEDVSFLTRL